MSLDLNDCGHSSKRACHANEMVHANPIRRKVEGIVMFGKSTAVAAAATMLTVMPAWAGETTAPDKKVAKDPNEVVCEKQEVLGSRVGSKKICMTRAEW